MPPHPSGRLPATFRRLLVLALLLPMAIVVCRYKSLWYDEASLGINIVTRSFGRLFEPLAYVQVAPIGFLLLAKLSNTLFGHNDFAIRLPSLAAYLCLFAALARRADRSPAQLLRFVLIVASPAVLRYAFELKQYISDVLLIVVLLEFGEALFSRAGRALLVSSLAVALSNVAFIQVPIFALLAGVAQVRSGVTLRTVAVRLAAAALPLGVYYFAFVAHHPSQANMIAYWASELPFGPGHHENLAMFLGRRLYRLVRFSYLTPAAGVLWLLYLAGLLAYLRERRYSSLAATTLPSWGISASRCWACIRSTPDGSRSTSLSPWRPGRRTASSRFSGWWPIGITWSAATGSTAWPAGRPSRPWRSTVSGMQWSRRRRSTSARSTRRWRPARRATRRRSRCTSFPRAAMQFEYYAAQAHAVGRGFLEGYQVSRDDGWEPFLRDAAARPRVAAILSHSRDLFGGRPFTARQVAEEIGRRLRERDPSDSLGLRVGHVSWANGAALVEVEQSPPRR